MTSISRIALSAALAVGFTVAAGAEESKKPSATTQSAQAAAASQVTLNVPRPDFKAWPSDQYIFVVNYGDKDYTGALDVDATCTSKAANPPADACGANFPNGKFHYHMANFPAGHGNAPVKGSG